MDIRILNPEHPTWGHEIDHLYTLLGGAQNPTLFPYHFLQAVLPKIGGSIAILCEENTPSAVGFLLPRLPTTPFPPGGHVYTMRYHALPGRNPPEQSLFIQACEHRIGGTVIPYDPYALHDYEPSHQTCGEVDIGRPNHAEAIAIRTLQQQVWGSPPEFLYPVDIHSKDFGLASSLVARINSAPAGFLFGFLKYCTSKQRSSLPSNWFTRFGGDLRIESQALGVLPSYRGARLGFLLKKMQAQQALKAGIQIINWTVDPLQWPNALLNFGLLRALALDFTPNYYPFRNELNRVAASRFSLTWLVNTDRVHSQCRLHTSDATAIESVVLDLEKADYIPRLNDGCRLSNLQVNAEQIAIEIPPNWTAVQRDDIDTAHRWRATTDALFQRYLGTQHGKYVVTDVGVAGARRFLVAQRASAGLWLRLG